MKINPAKPKPKRKGKRLDFYLSDNIYSEMEKVCLQAGFSKTEFLRRAVLSYTKLYNAYLEKIGVVGLPEGCDVNTLMSDYINKTTAKKGD